MNTPKEVKCLFDSLMLEWNMCAEEKYNARCRACNLLLGLVNIVENPIELWYSIFEIFNTTSSKCKRCKERWKDIGGSFCVVDQCLNCFFDGSDTTLPTYTNIEGMIDHTMFSVKQLKGSLPTCGLQSGTHTDSFQIKILASLPKIALFALPSLLHEDVITIFPLQMNLEHTGPKSRNLSNFVYLPSSETNMEVFQYSILRSTKKVTVEGRSFYFYLVKRNEKFVLNEPRTFEDVYSTFENICGYHINLSEEITKSRTSLEKEVGKKLKLSRKEVVVPRKVRKGRSRSGRVNDIFKSKSTRQYENEHSNRRHSNNSRRDSNFSKSHNLLIKSTSGSASSNSGKTKIIPTAKEMKERIDGDSRDYLEENLFNLLKSKEDHKEESENRSIMEIAQNGSSVDLSEVESSISTPSTSTTMLCFESCDFENDDELEERIDSFKETLKLKKKSRKIVERKIKECAENICKMTKSPNFEFKIDIEDDQNGYDSNYLTPFLSKPGIHFQEVLIESRKETSQVISLQESYRMLSQNEFKLINPSISKTLKIQFDEESSSETNDLFSLKLHSDIDSIDFITVYCGGNAFMNTPASIPKVWKGNFDRSDKLEGNNVSFASFNARSQYFPGNYFGNKTASRFSKNRYLDDNNILSPMQISLMQLDMGIGSNSIPVDFIVPSGVLQLFLQGDGVILELFEEACYTSISTQIDEKRKTLASMMWYIVSSVILYFASMSCSDGINCQTWIPCPCCAIPKTNRKNKELHDRTHGLFPQSGSKNWLSKCSLTIALCFFARHQRALEQECLLPEHLCAQALRKKHCYSLDENQLALVRDDLREVLEEPVGSIVCLRYFREFWKSRPVWNNEETFIYFNSDSSRRGENALCSDISNTEALERKYLVVEDLIPLSHIVFRATQHGLKSPFFDLNGIKHISKTLKNCIAPYSLLDGYVDIAAVMLDTNSNPGSSIHLRNKACSHDNRIIFPDDSHTPTERLNSLCKSSKGTFKTTVRGFPTFCGLSTGSGKCGEKDSVLRSNGILGFKIYETIWRNNSNRGTTVYDGKPYYELEKGLCSGLKIAELAGRESNFSSKIKITKISSFNSNFNCLLHSLDGREKNILNSTRANSGLRYEIRYNISVLFQTLEEWKKIFEFQQDAHNLGYENFVEDVKQNPERWPWWMTIPKDGGVFKTRNLSICKDNLPISIIPGETITLFFLLLERKLLQMSKYLLNSLINPQSGFTSEDESIICSTDKDLIKSICSGLNANCICEVVSLASRSLLKSSKIQASSLLCHYPSFPYPTFLDSDIVVSGILPSIFMCGYPSICLDRILFSVLGKKGKIGSLEIPEEDSNKLLPPRFQFMSTAFQNHMNLRKQDILTNSKIDSEHYLQTPFLSISTILKEINSLSEFNSMSQKKIEGVCCQLACLIVKLLIADVLNTISIVGFGKKKFERRNGSVYEKRSRFNMSMSTIRFLANLTLSEKRWSNFHRIDCSFDEPPVQLEKEKAVEALLQNHNKIIESKRKINMTKEDITLSSSGNIKTVDFVKAFMQCARRISDQQSEFQKPSWASIVCLKELFSRKQSLSISSEQKKFFQLIQKELPTFLSKSLWSAGFDTICPHIYRVPKEFKCTTNPWSKKLPFSNLMFQEVESRMSSTNSTKKYLEYHEELLLILSERNMLEEDSEKWVFFNDKYIKKCKTIWNSSMIKEDLLKFVDNRFNEAQEKLNLNRNDHMWIRKVLKTLIHIRCKSGDEGLSIIVGENESFKLYRDSGENETSGCNIRDSVQSPWGSLYPSSESIYGHRSTMYKIPQWIYGNCAENQKSFLFKTIPVSILKRRISSIEELKMALTEDIYQSFYLQREKQASSRNQWRLSPTCVILEIIIEERNEKLSTDNTKSKKNISLFR